MTGIGPNGPVPLTWQELAAYSALKQSAMEPVCWQILRDMSAAYVAALQTKSPLAKMPMERLDDD